MAHHKKPQHKKTADVVAASPPAGIVPAAENGHIAENGPLLRKAFFASLVAMLLLAWVSGFNVGFHSDEMDMNNYCKANLSYYLTRGADTSFLGGNISENVKLENVMRYYGTSFEYIPVVFNKVTHLDQGRNEFNSRHIFVQFFGILAVLFTGLIARKFAGWRTALFTIWLLFLTPAFLGGTLFNSKDIPFCTGYMATVYFMICFLEELPTPSWKTTLLLMASFAFTTGIRIGGIMFLFDLCLFLCMYMFTNKALFRQVLAGPVGLLARLLTVVFGGLVLVVITWPFLLLSPLTNLLASISVVKKFPMRVPLNFDGVYTDSLTIPAYYLPKIMAITIPVFILAAIVWGVVKVFADIKKLDAKIIAIILFTSIFPAAYAILSNVALYSAWRHMMFIYPGLCVVAGYGLNELFSLSGKRTFRYAFFAICGLGMIRPVAWMVQNHPYEYTYFNEIAGGYKKAFYEYETDYWKVTMKKGVQWMMQQPDVINAKDTVVVGTDMQTFVRYYIQRNYPGAKVRIGFSELGTRYRQQWRYAIYSKLFLPPEYLEKYYPPCNTVFSEDIDGLPETVVLRDTVRLDHKAVMAFGEKKYLLADSFISEELRLDDCRDKIGLYGLTAIIKAFVGKNQEAFDYANKDLQYNFSHISNCDALVGMGIAFGNVGRYDNAVGCFRKALNVMPASKQARVLLNSAVEMQQKAQGTH